MQNAWNQYAPRPNKPQPCLTFAPLTWLKLQYFCHAGATEIGGFGISAEDDLLFVEDFVTIPQQVTPVSVRFPDDAVADFFDHCVDQGLYPEQFGRIWCHTHPGESVTPSNTDEETFTHAFGNCDWALMFILGRTARTYARLAFAAGPTGSVLLPTAVDWSSWPDWVAGGNGLLEAKCAQWQKDYAAHVHALPQRIGPLAATSQTDPFDCREGWESQPWDPELDAIFYDLVQEERDHEPHARPRTS